MWKRFGSSLAGRGRKTVVSVAESPWRSLAIPDRVIQSLIQSGFDAPLESQRLAIPALRRRATNVLSSQTGTGKTLAYAIPILEQLLENRSSLALIFTPSIDLCIQVDNLFRRLLSQLDGGLHSAHLRPSMMPASLLEAAVIVTTPNAANDILTGDRYSPIMERLSTVVVDEADHLLIGGGGHSVALRQILSRNRKSTQIAHTFVGATLPSNGSESPGQIIRKLFPDVQTTSHVGNVISANVTRTFVKLDFKNDQAVIQALSSAVIKGERTLIFCNTSSSADHVVSHWLMAPYRPALFTGRTSVDNRVAILAALLQGTIKVLVCTDMAARGLDFPSIDHVIEFEFARDGVTHLHRVGRTGRCGQRGKVTSFYDDDRESLVGALQGIADDQAIDSVFSRKRSFRKRIKKATAIAESAHTSF
uniref:ATP-dependent RNA helicase n=1 Tax=Spongospora subterranea TaxID=70186 RepID=A0A0H5QZX2_9EUKA|eukprot:CRZ07450.1 hypothetical protein [Spongospora subterranea]